MSLRRTIWFRLRSLGRRSVAKREIDDELSFHIEQRVAENIAAGMTTNEAALEARNRFGNFQSVRENCREMRGASFGEAFVKDIRFGARMLRKNPGFTTVAVLTLALGIGANTAVFSLVNAILLRSLPVPSPQELRVIEWSGSEVHNTRNSGNRSTDGTGRVTQDAFSYPLFLALREQCSAQSDIFGYALLHGVTARSGLESVSAEGVLVSDNFFSGLGVRPFMGRLLGRQDEIAGTDQTLVISYRWWEQRFNRDPDVLGKSVALNGFNFDIVGVLPADFAGVRSGATAEFYAPFAAQPQLLPREARTAPDHWWVPLMARLKPGVTDRQFQAALDVTFGLGAEPFMKQPKVLVADGRAGPDWGRRPYRRPLFLLLGVVCLVMLVACANVAGLSLARGAVRQHEFAVRAALGAARWRVIRQSVTESAVLAFAGGGLGIVIALWGKAGISRLLTGSPEGLHQDTTLDFRVLAFTLGVSVVTALLSGLLPALRAASVDPVAGLKDRATLGAPRLRTGRVLVAGQIALSMLLIVGAELYARTLIKLKHINPGFATENLLLFQLNPGNAGYRDPRIAAFYDRVEQSLAAIPGVGTTALVRFPLLNGNGAGTPVTLPSHAADRTPESETQTLVVSETFFRTMGIPIQQGRELRSSDDTSTPGVAVVNETFVRNYLQGQDPIGLTMKAEGADWRIVGVCADVRFADIKAEAPPTVYWSFRQKSTGSAWFALRTALPPMAVAAAARKAVSEIDPNIPVTDLTTQEQVRDNSISQERMFVTLCGALAALSVLLSCNGLYGLMAYHVSRRTGEMGIRMALGANRLQIAGPILKEAVVLAGTGVAIGIPLTLALTQIIRGNLYGVRPSDPLALCGGVALLVGVALVAAWIPARRAMKVDPMAALRYE
jgi:predicted permease